jgi:hypothetical protein
MGDQTPGFIIFVLIASAVLSVPVAAVLWWLYRRSVQRGMTTGASDSEGPLPSVSAAPARAPIRIIDRAGDPPAYAERSLREVVTIYCAVGLAFALLFAIGWGMQSKDGMWAWSHLLALAMTLAAVKFWPAVLAIELVARVPGRSTTHVAAALGETSYEGAVGAESLPLSGGYEEQR